MQKFWLPIICSLLLSVSTTGSAATSVQLYSALGEQLLAEVPLLPEEVGQDLSSFQVEGAGHSWGVLKIPGQPHLLLFSEAPVHDPIVGLTLFVGASERPLTLFVDPVAPSTPKALFMRLFESHRQQLAAQQQLLEKAQQLQQPSWEVPVWEVQWQRVKSHALSSWLFFLLLGGGVALLIVRWWRSAEWVDLNHQDSFTKEDHGAVGEEETTWSAFRQGVAEIESQIRPAASRDSDRNLERGTAG